MPPIRPELLDELLDELLQDDQKREDLLKSGCLALTSFGITAVSSQLVSIRDLRIHIISV